MKKMLILMLVLGFASTASALVVELGAGGTTNGAGVDMTTALTTLEVVSDTAATPYVRYLISWDDSALDITGVSVLTAAGSDAFVTDFGAGMGAGTRTWEIQAMDSSPPLDSILAGIQFNVGVSIGALGGQMELLDESMATTLDTITVVPEPMTIALLGLGGLFLRRRK